MYVVVKYTQNVDTVNLVYKLSRRSISQSIPKIMNVLKNVFFSKVLVNSFQLALKA